MLGCRAGSNVCVVSPGVCACMCARACVTMSAPWLWGDWGGGRGRGDAGRPRPPLQVGWARGGAGRARCSWLAAAPGSQGWARAAGRRRDRKRKAAVQRRRRRRRGSASKGAQRRPQSPDAVSRERGPRSPHGRRRGESRGRPGAGCIPRAQRRPRRGVPAPPTPHWDPGSPPSPPPRRTPTVPPGIPLLSQACEVRLSCPGPCLPRVRCCAPLPRHSLPAPRTPTVALAALWGAPRGARSGRPAGSGRRSRGTGWPYRPCGGGEGDGGPLSVPREPGADRRSQPAAGLDPVTASARSRRVLPGSETGTEPACVRTSLTKLSRPQRPGGRVRLRPGERNRQVGVYFQKTPGWSGRHPASLCPRCPGWKKSLRAGAAFATGRTSFPPAVFEHPQATRPEKCEAL